jgi:hypothetical protein
MKSQRLALLGILCAGIFSSFAVRAAIPESIGPRLNCVKEAEAAIGSEFPIHDHESALKLCQGATSVAPKSCADAARKAFRTTDFAIALSDNDILSLCQGATSNGPVDCAKAAAKFVSLAGDPIKSVSDITLLCHHATDTSSVDCVEELKSEAKSLMGAAIVNLSDVVIACTTK